MTTTIDSDSVVSDATSIDDTDSPYTTSGEDTIQVDTSSGSVTVTLASADVSSGREIRIVDAGLNAGTNNITINTESSETINPGSNSQISIAIDGGYEDLWSDGGNWFSSRQRESQTLSVLQAANLNNAISVSIEQFGGGDIGGAFNNARDAHPNKKSFAINPGEYTVTTPLDLTSNRPIQNATLDLRGVTLNGETSGSPVIDTTGSRAITIIEGQIVGQSTNTPSVGILQARDGSGASIGDDRFYSVDAVGEYTIAAMYNVGAEVCGYSGIRARNDIGHGFAVDGENNLSVSSPYVSVNSGVSTNDISIAGESTLKTKANDATHAALYIGGGADSVSVKGGVVISDSLAGVLFQTSPGIQLPEISTRFHPTTNGLPTHDIKIQGGGAVQNPVFKQNFYQATDEVVKLDTDTSITHGLHTFGHRYVSGDAEYFAGTVRGGGHLVIQPEVGSLTNTTMTFDDWQGHGLAAGTDISYSGTVEFSAGP